MRRVELCGCDHFRKLFHIGRLDVQNICEVSYEPGSPFSFRYHCGNALKLWSLMDVFQRLIRRSSALRKVSSSELIEMELIW